MSPDREIPKSNHGDFSQADELKDTLGTPDTAAETPAASAEHGVEADNRAEQRNFLNQRFEISSRLGRQALGFVDQAWTDRGEEINDRIRESREQLQDRLELPDSLRDELLGEVRKAANASEFGPQIQNASLSFVRIEPIPKEAEDKEVEARIDSVLYAYRTVDQLMADFDQADTWAGQRLSDIDDQVQREVAILPQHLADRSLNPAAAQALVHEVIGVYDRLLSGTRQAIARSHRSLEQTQGGLASDRNDVHMAAQQYFAQ